MLATAADTLPTGPVWTYELKWDGYRTLAIKSGSAVRLLSRNLKNLTGDYPGIAAAIAHHSCATPSDEGAGDSAQNAIEIVRGRRAATAGSATRLDWGYGWSRRKW